MNREFDIRLNGMFGIGSLLKALNKIYVKSCFLFSSIAYQAPRETEASRK